MINRLFVRNLVSQKLSVKIKKNKTFCFFILGIAAMIGICFIYSLAAGHYVDFFPINGTFQNFNPVRRILNGQVPYKDFQDYLGMGHLYGGTFFTWLFGGNYRASLIGFTFLTILSAALIAFAVGKAVFGKKEESLIFTNMFLLLLIVQPLFYKYFLAGTEDVLNALNCALSPGNSARFVRGMILPITCLLLVMMDRVHIVLQKRKTWYTKWKNLSVLCGMAVIAGFAFAWSNDYGISCWVCLAIMVFLVIWSREKKLFRAFGGMMAEIVLSFAALFVIVEIFTLGHFPGWLKSVFGTGGYQAWYYNSEKSYYLYDIDFTYFIWIQGIICVVYIIKMFRQAGSKYAVLRYGVLAYANMVCFCAANEYKLFSGGENREVALSVLFITVLAEGCRYIWSFMEKHGRQIVRIGIFLSAFAWIFTSMANELIVWKPEGTYVSQMGGYMTKYASDLASANKFLNGEKVFSTYASAQEIVEGIYQPSGTDYIIHVLGDDAREDYLEKFKTLDFKYTATIKENFTEYGYWMKSANWFFFRELYRNWHPIYENSYELYWERNRNEEQNILSGEYSVEIADLGNSTKKIIIQTDASVNGVADVCINYEAKKRKGGIDRWILFQTMVKVQNSGIVYAQETKHESNFLRPKNEEYIPIMVVDGYGEVTLTSCPEENTDLEVYSASCSEIFTDEFGYVKAESVVDYGEQTIISVTKNSKTEKILENVKEVIVAGNSYAVSEIQSDDTYLYLVILTSGQFLNQDGTVLENGNMFPVIK